MPTEFELNVWADGVATDADGNRLNADGKPVETNDQPEADEESEQS